MNEEFINQDLMDALWRAIDESGLGVQKIARKADVSHTIIQQWGRGPHRGLGELVGRRG